MIEAVAPEAGPARPVQEAGNRMTSYSDYEAILAVIEAGIEKARRNPKPGEPMPSDDYTAWVILQELRRSGWNITPISN